MDNIIIIDYLRKICASTHLAVDPATPSNAKAVGPPCASNAADPSKPGTLLLQATEPSAEIATRTLDEH